MATCKDCLHYEVCKPMGIAMMNAMKAGSLTADVEHKCYIRCFKPTADVAEVKHGEWIAKASTHISKRGRLINYDRYKCSACGVWNGRHKPDFCPHCGAKMDGEREGAE